MQVFVIKARRGVLRCCCCCCWSSEPQKPKRERRVGKVSSFIERHHYFADVKTWLGCLFSGTAVESKQLSSHEATWGQFHQHSKFSFYVRKLRTQLFCAYVLGLYFTGVSLPVQKLLIERWWNWALIYKFTRA